MVRDTGKAQDALLDWANENAARIGMCLIQLDIFRERGLTENEIAMLSTIESLLKAPEA